MDDLTQREFLIELADLTEQLFAVTADLRREDSGPWQRENLARAFRCLHSIKGIASSADLTGITELAHQTENVLERIRAERIPIETTFIDTLEDVAQAIAESLTIKDGSEVPAANELLVRRLNDFAADAIGSSASISLTALPGEITASLDEREKQLLAEALDENANLCLIDAHFDIGVFDTEFQKLRDALAHYGEVICTVPSAEGPAGNRIGFRLFYSSRFAAGEVQTRILDAFPGATVTELAHPLPASPEVALHQQAASGAGADAAPSTAGSISVKLDELDRLHAGAHEVFDQIVNALDLVSRNLQGETRTELSNLYAQVRQALTALEEQIGALRTVSVSRLLQRTMIAGRVAARNAGKEVNFSLVGNELRLDKEICDALATPLLHLIRNAVDHGIETPAERLNAGKSAAGSVRIEAGSYEGAARFIVSDDGRGIDPQVISLAAAARGLIQKDMILDMDQSLRLIFRAGFSTAATVSNLSGRGVGLDVVEHSLARIRGSVIVRSEPGKGSEFELRLPKSRSGS